MRKSGDARGEQEGLGVRQGMNKDVLLEMVKQNQFTSQFSFDRVTEENAGLRSNDRTASIGFIYRYIGETFNLFGQLLGTVGDSPSRGRKMSGLCAATRRSLRNSVRVLAE